MIEDTKDCLSIPQKIGTDWLLSLKDRNVELFFLFVWLLFLFYFNWGIT